MNIAIDVSQMCYRGTGVARYVRGMTSALLNAKSPYRFTLWAGALKQQSFFKQLRQESPWNRASWRLSPLPPKLALSILGRTNLPVESFMGSADLIHTSDWVQPFSRSPLVTTVHDLAFKKYPETIDPLILRAQTKRLERIKGDNSHIVVDSESTKHDLIELYQVQESRLSVIYPGIDAQYAPQTAEKIKAVKHKYHLPEKYLLSLGTQEPRKNLARLIEACQQIELPLVLTGKYGWGEHVKANSSRVITTGYVDETDLPALYSGASVFIYPSLYEGFGFPILEAMACGVPVVTSNVSSLPEIGGSAAIYCDPLKVESISHAIAQALKESQARSKQSLKQAKKFSWEKTAQELLACYSQVIKESHS